MTTAQKIVSLLTFKIPYFVGPLNTAHSENQKGFAWVSKHSDFENKQITPWNYHLAVNETESGERFIERMTSKCTYMTDCNVLPKQSLLYQKYLVLNDLNNLKINGNRISPELKQFLFATLFQISPSVSKSKIKKHLEDWQKIPRGSVIGSEDDDNNAFHANLSSLIKFKQIFGEQFDKIPKVEELCEDIVRWHTIFASEKKMVSHKIEQIYGNILKELYEETEYKKLLGKLKGLSFSGWARFSKEFLTEIFCCYKPTGEANLSLIKALEETNLNLMELLNSDQFEPQYLEKVRQANTKENTVIDYDYVHDLYCSPSVKRSIWQTNKIVDDIVKIMDHTPPKKVFVEVTRQSQKDKKTGKGKVTNSRKNALLKMYENLKEENDLKHILETQSDKDLRGDKLYLYFAQLGKCAYSGKIIDLSKLSSNDYDIDHIYPQSKIKDDSLTNRVLVVKEENAKKGDLYPLPESIQAKMLPTWNAWLAMDLIRKEKYQRLIRKTQLSDGELTAFIDRQMVTTNQAIKEVATMMDIKWNQDQKQTKIVYSKANHVSDFRKKFDIPKSRDVNRLHHAKDAYLNVVVGNVWDTMFGDLRTIKAKDKNKFVWNEEKAINRLFEPTYEKWTRNGEEVLKEKCNKRDLKDAWSFGEDKDENGFLQNHGTLLTVKKWCKENRYLVTTRSFVQKGEMFNQTRHMKQEESKVDTTILLKETKKQDGSILFDPRKYGGYKSANSAYAVCCKSDVMKKQKISSGANKGEVEFVKDGEMITLHPIPIMYAERKEYQNKEKLEQLVAKLYNLTNPTILAEKIPYWSMLEIDDIRYQIRGFSGNTIQLNIAYEWHTTKENEQYVHDIAKYIEMESKKEVVIAEEEKQRQTKIEYANGKIISKEKNLQLYEEIEKQVAKPFYKSYSSKFVNGSKEIKESMKQNFVSLSTYQQVKVLIELMKFITAGGTLANLKAIGGSANETCKVSMSNKITDKKVKWIHQSPTGFYEQSVVLSSGNVLEVNASGGV